MLASMDIKDKIIKKLGLLAKQHSELVNAVQSCGQFSDLYTHSLLMLITEIKDKHHPDKDLLLAYQDFIKVVQQFTNLHLSESQTHSILIQFAILYSSLVKFNEILLQSQIQADHQQKNFDATTKCSKATLTLLNFKQKYDGVNSLTLDLYHLLKEAQTQDAAHYQQMLSGVSQMLSIMLQELNALPLIHALRQNLAPQRQSA